MGNLFDLPFHLKCLIISMLLFFAITIVTMIATWIQLSVLIEARGSPALPPREYWMLFFYAITAFWTRRMTYRCLTDMDREFT
jgi:hypothetical protein